MSKIRHALSIPFMIVGGLLYILATNIILWGSHVRGYDELTSLLNASLDELARKKERITKSYDHTS